MWTYIYEKLKEITFISPLKQLMDSHRTVTVFVTGALIYGAWFFKRPRNLPPGPYGYPVLGCLPLFGKGLSFFKTLNDKYGDIFTFWLGGNR